MPPEPQPGPTGGGIQVPQKYQDPLANAVVQAGIPYEVGAAQIQTESDFDPNAVSPAGAQGIAQFEPGTWAHYGHGSPFNPDAALKAYGDYMAALMKDEHGNLADALAAYNAGPANLDAGMGYAEHILQEAGEQPTKNVPYRNPLRDVQGLAAERIDMGVDYSGSGPVHALGPGVITATDNAGWPGGHFIAEKLTEGPLAGHYVYVAEDIDPQVKVGQKVTSSTVIGQMAEGGIETGFAAPPGTGNALGASQFSGSNTTAYGAAYSKILSALGAPAGKQQNTPTGSTPDWLNGIIKDIGKLFNPIGTAVGAAGGLGGVSGAISDVGSAVHGIEEALSWFTPSKILRTMCFFAGSALTVYGVIALARPRVTLPVLGSTPVVPAGELGPAFGIASVTIGACLLFFAFHNIEAQNFGQFLGAIQGRLHGQPVPVTS